MAASQATNRPRIGLLDQLEIKWNTAIRSQTNDPAFNLDFKNGFFRQTIVSSYFSIYKTELGYNIIIKKWLATSRSRERIFISNVYRLELRKDDNYSWRIVDEKKEVQFPKFQMNLNTRFNESFSNISNYYHLSSKYSRNYYLDATRNL